MVSASMTARRWGAVSSVVILLASVVFVWFATRSEGDVVRKTDLFDGGVWVSNAEQSRFGRLNKPAGQLDAGVAAPGTASSGIDIAQDGAAVVGISKAANQLLPINPKTATLSESSQVTLPAVTPAAASATSPNAPAASVVDLRGGTLAVVDPAKGTLWAQRVDTRAGIGTLEQVQPSAKPRAAVGAAAAVAVGTDGTVYAASGTKGSLVTLRLAPGGADFADPVTTPLGFTSAQLQLTAVGGHWVALDGATGKVWSDGQAEPTPLGTVTGRPVLQQPGPDALTVLVQTGDALLAVPLAGGAAATRSTLSALPTPGAGSTPGGLLPSPPVRLGDCVHAGWAGPDAVFYGRACSGATDQPAVQLGTLGKGVRTDGVRLRVNRGLIALNDLDSGNVWDVDDKPVKVDNWDSVIPPPQQADQNQKKDPNQVDDQIVTTPPQAEPDELNVRPGRTSTLHVLDNDSDSQGSILGIAPGDIGKPDAADVATAVSVDGQTVEVTVPAAPAETTFRFSYTVNNGGSGANGKATGSVVVHIVDDSVNTPPFVRGGTAKLAQAKYPAVRSGHVTVGVVADWRDGENDPLGVDTTDPGVSVDPSGALGVTAPDQPGGFGVKYTVGDGHGGSTPGQATVNVLADDARAEPPQTQPDVIRAVVGKPVQVQPLGNDVPGADPTDPGARMRLATEVRGPGALVVDTNLDTGVLTVTGSAQGTFLVTYAAQVGSAVSPGRIRVDILPNPSDDQPPVAAPDAATVRDQEPVIADVLSNDYSPRSDVLVVQKAVSDVTWLQPSVVQGRFLRVQAGSPLITGDERRGSIDYTISDGTKTAVGHVSVVQKARPDTPPLPSVEDDDAVVRIGDVVTIPVLDNDTMSGGVPLKLDPQGVKVVAGKGQVFTSGSVVRFIPDPTPITADDVVTLEYATYPEGSPDRAVTGRVTVTVKPLPTPTTPNQPPTARSVTASVTAGDTITVTVPTSGIDPDGDLTYVAGILGSNGGPVDLALGRVVSFGATTVKYEAYPRSAGTEVIRYVVRDRFGATSEAFVRVGVVQPGDPQPPVAVTDDIVAAPGRTVTADVLANDLISPDDEVTYVDLTTINEPTALARFTKLDDQTFRVTVPEEGPATVLAYGITDGLFDPSRAALSVRGQKGFNNPPTAVDDTAVPKPGETSTTVDVLANDRDLDGDASTLTLVEAVGEGVTVVGRQVQIALLDHPRVVPYVIADADGAKAMGLVYVPTADNGAPYVTPGKVVQMDTNGSATVDLADYVTDPRGRTVKVTSPDTVSTSPKDALASEPKSDTSIALTASKDYNGPAALMLQVTDQTGPDDQAGLTAYLSILVQVGPKVPILRCPDYLVNLVGGGQPRTVDIPRLCHAWLPTGLDPAAAEYTASWSQPVPDVDLKPTGVGNREFVLTAAAKASGDGAVTVAAVGSKESFPIRVHATPTEGPKPTPPPGAPPPPLAQQVPPLVVSPITVAALNAGASETVNVAPYLQSPLASPACSLRPTVMLRSGTGVTGTASGCSITVTAAKDARGTATLVFEASDGPGRLANGEVRVSIRGVPDAPTRVSAAADRTAGGLARVSWSPPANDGGLPVLQYEVRSSTGQTLSCQASPCTVSGLKNGQPVSFTVRARNAVDWSAPSAPSPEVTPDTAPRAVTVGAVTPGDRTLAVTWAAPVNEGSAVDQYQVQWVNTAGGAGGGTRVVAAPTLTTTLTGLVNDNAYTIRVQAHNGAGWGPYGPSVTKQSFGTPPAVAAPQVSPRAANANDSTGQVTVTWSTTDPNGPPITKYTVYRRVGGGAFTALGTVSGSASRTYTNSGIPYDGKTYEYTVTATNGGGAESPKSNTTSYRATGIPAVPGAPTVVESGFDYLAKVTVTLGDSRASSFTSVKWRSTGGDSGTWACGGCADGTTRTFTTTRLPTTVQNISVSACNDATPVQCSGWSGGSSVHPYGPTQAVTGLKSTVTGSGGNYTITWTWNNVSNGRAYDKVTVSGAVDRTLGGNAESVSVSAGYSASKSITVTPSVTTPQGTDAGPGRSDSATTPDRPPPTVKVTEGGSCSGSSCDPQAPGNCRTTCYFVVIASGNWQAGSMTCDVSGASQGQFATKTVQTNGTHQTTAFYGYGDTVTIRCRNGSESASDSKGNWGG